MKLFPRSAKYFCILTMFTAIAMTLSCGEGSDNQEYVYLYIFNGYPGSSQMSLYGPSGRVVSGLPFRGRTTEPIKISRNLGTDFTLVIDGAPQTIDLQFELYDLYPQETGTLFFKRRSSTTDAVATIYRHTPSISSNCRLLIDNGLSIQSSGVANYNFMVAFRFENINSVGYLDNDPRGAAFLQGIRNNPYFFLVQHPEIMNSLLAIWVGTTPDRPSSVDYSTGIVLGHPTTLEVLDCLGEDPPTPETLTECTQPQNYSGTLFVPDQSSIEFFDLIPDNAGQCEAHFRIYSDFGNIFEGEHQDGVLVEDTVSMSSGDHLFWVLYGRPVTPRIGKWTSSDPSTGGGFVPLPPEPTP